MKSGNLFKCFVTLALIFAWTGQTEAQDSSEGTFPSFTLPGPKIKTFSPGDRKIHEVATEEVWWQTTPSMLNQMSSEELADMADNHWLEMVMEAENLTIVNNNGPLNANATTGLDVVYVLGASVPAAAISAFAAAEAYLESQFPNDPFTLTVSVSFASLSPGVIGGTGSSYVQLTYPTFGSAFTAGNDANDVLVVPTGSTIPVRYRTNKTTNETRIFATTANWKAMGGTVSGNDASMQYSTNFPFDFDPSNGVTTNTISLQDVIIHETGHAMGFTSGVDFRTSDIEVLDVFRFRNTDSTSDFNPDTLAEFTIRPRWAVKNNPNDDCNFDLISVEYLASDGSPWQASHFREVGAGPTAVGIMEPAFSYGETFYPNFMKQSDLDMFDAIGYDR